MLLESNIEEDFNPRSREGSDEIHIKSDYPTIISIHAPARGATLAEHNKEIGSLISIHAPARGATTQINILQINIIFQSTLPRGERLNHSLTAWLLL